MSDSINCNPSKIIKWFTDGEKCLMHSNTSPIEIIETNLTSDQIDQLIERGKAICGNYIQ
ncbi:MAG: hypothetical protein O3A49_04555 [Candidatus Marinimicrobia bacterium]|nr:hypothetical protein [Candidatus Neomarinimicrobiota bacterium]